MYVRGSLQDYNDWADLCEDKGWSAESMYHYLRKHQVFSSFPSYLSLILADI